MLTYHPALPASAGKVGGYKLVAEEAHPNPKNHLTVVTDDSGVVQYRYDGDLSVRQTYVYSGGGGLHPLLTCLLQENFIGNRSEAEVAEKLRTCSTGLYYLNWRADHGFVSGGYFTRYQLTLNSRGKVVGFSAEARPVKYGELYGVRSYFAVGKIDSPGKKNSVNVYATPENRPATASDPLALACELGWGDCSHPAILPN